MDYKKSETLLIASLLFFIIYKVISMKKYIDQICFPHTGNNEEAMLKVLLCMFVFTHFSWKIF